MNTWKRTFHKKKQDPLFEASAAEAFYKLTAIVRIMEWTQAQLRAGAPHADILNGMDERLAVGLKAPDAPRDDSDGQGT